MGVKYFDKTNVDEIEFSSDQWDRTIDADGNRTYTATTGGAEVTVKFRPPRANQEHSGVKQGSKVVRHKDGSVTLEMQT